MAVTETLDALGQWNVTLVPNTPKAILDKLQYFGHFVVDIGEAGVEWLSDGNLKPARYVGVYTGQDNTGSLDFSGVGMATWLGDADQKGQVIESLLTFANSSMHDCLTAILPSALHIGTIFPSVTLPFTGTFQWTDPRTALDTLTQTTGSVWRVNGDATVDVGKTTDLYRTIPNCAVINEANAGVDTSLIALRGSFENQQDVEDFTTRVLYLASGTEGSTLEATADIDPGLNPYLDMFGNPVKLTRMVSDSSTDPTNAPSAAQLQLNRFTSPRNAVTLSSDGYDIRGVAQVGDNIYVYDLVTGLYDLTNDVMFRGEHIFPIVLQCTELSWPIIQGMRVGFRDGHGNWTDLTPYVNFETGTTTITVGGYDRSLTNTGQPVSSRPLPDTSIPGPPSFNNPSTFPQAIYQSAVNGQTRGQVQLSWITPENTDGTAIIDGDHYEIRYRTGSTPLFPVTFTQLSNYTFDQLKNMGGTFRNPIAYPVLDWTYLDVPWPDITVLLQDLLPSMPYQAQVRAVDSANPPNAGDWSPIINWQTLEDIVPPATPAPPAVASSLIAVQVTHDLGQASGGTFNLDSDLHHLEVHGQYEPLFEPVDATLLGKLIANAGMITGGIPAVGTFQVSATVPTYFKVIAVDTAGNKSRPSIAASATAQLIDNAHISDLTVSKLTSGTISADMILSGSFKTATTGARVEMNNLGLWGFDTGNNTTFHLSDTDGTVYAVGTFRTGNSVPRLEMNPNYTLAGAGTFPSLLIYDTDAHPPARMNAVFNPTDGTNILGINSGASNNTANFQQSTIWLADDRAFMQMNDQANAAFGGGVFVDAGQAGFDIIQAGVPKGGVRVYTDTNVSRAIEFDGHLAKFYSDPYATLYPGNSDVVSTGAWVYVFSYGYTLETLANVDVTPYGGNADFYACVLQRTTTGFNYGFSGSASNRSFFFMFVQ